MTNSVDALVRELVLTTIHSTETYKYLVEVFDRLMLLTPAPTISLRQFLEMMAVFQEPVRVIDAIQSAHYHHHPPMTKTLEELMRTASQGRTRMYVSDALSIARKFAKQEVEAERDRIRAATQALNQELREAGEAPK